MDQKVRCQSCGMPLMEGNFGTTTDGGKNPEYCMFCFKNGAFTEPELNLEGMIQKSINFMSSHLNFSKEKAEEMSREVIPKLKRWQ